MDAQGIDVEAQSINPIWYRLERDLASQIIKIPNEKLAEVCAAQPDRFVAFASVALQYPDLAVQQFEDAVRKLGLRDAAVGANVAGVDFSDPKFHPFWAKGEQLGVLIFIHAGIMPELASSVKGNGVLKNVIGIPLETTIVPSHLVSEGTLDRFPGLKICAAHGGGYLPSYAAWSDHGCLTFPERCDPNIVLKKKPSEYLKQLHFLTRSYSPPMRCGTWLRKSAPARLSWARTIRFCESTAVEHILKTPGLSDAERTAMLGDTAARLLSIS